MKLAATGRSANGQAALDDALGLGSMFSTRCALCRGDLEFATDALGRSIERCRSCGHTQYLATAAVRPDGDGYRSHTRDSAPRREPRRFPETTDDVDVQLLRATRDSRASAPPSAAMVEAHRAYDAMQEAQKQARKGGRPRGPSLALGRQGRPTRGGPIVILNDDGTVPDPVLSPVPRRSRDAAVGPPLQRPPATPVVTGPPAPAVSPPTSNPAMSTNSSTRPASQCGHDVPVRNGPAPKLCDDCKAAAPTPAASTRASATAKKKKRAPIATGFKRAASTAVDGLAGVIGQLEAELAALDDRRDKVAAALEQLRGVAGA